PPKLLISISTPCFLKMPVRSPTSAGTNENASRPALPTRKVSAEATAATSEQSIPTRTEIKTARRKSHLVWLGFAREARSVCPPPPCGGGVGRGVAVVATAQQLRPPPPTPPHKGEGSTPSKRRVQ